MGTEEAGDDAPSNADGTTYGYDPGSTGPYGAAKNHVYDGTDTGTVPSTDPGSAENNACVGTFAPGNSVFIIMLGTLLGMLLKAIFCSLESIKQYYVYNAYD